MYEHFYLLDKMPFENSPNPDYLYLSKNHREVMASLVSGINSAKEFLLISGDVGTGKTTLIQALLRELDSNFIVIHINNPLSGFEGITYHLAKELSIHYIKKSNTSDLYNKIKLRLKQADRGGKRTLLIIDEAHLLGAKCLEKIRLLSNHVTENRKLLQVVLAGQSEIYSNLQKDSQSLLKKRITVNCNLQAMERKDVEEYIKHRLHIAGRREPLFDRRALFLIWKKSGGVPRVINQICDNALFIGYALGSKKIGAKVIEKVVGDMEAGYSTKTFSPNEKKNHLKRLFYIPLLSLFILIVSVDYTSKTEFSEYTKKDGSGQIAADQNGGRKPDGKHMLGNSNHPNPVTSDPLSKKISRP